MIQTITLHGKQAQRYVAELGGSLAPLSADANGNYSFVADTAHPDHDAIMERIKATNAKELCPTHFQGPWEFHYSEYPNGKLSGKPYVYAPNGPEPHRHICHVYLDDTNDPAIRAAQVANGVLLAKSTALLDALRIIELRLDRWQRLGIEAGPLGLDADWPKLCAQTRAALR